MKLFKKLKDGGPESKVTGYFLIEWKQLFSIVLLKFENGTCNAYHSHAFDALSWVLRGKLQERYIEKNPLLGTHTNYAPSLFPIWTQRKCMHKVSSVGTSWVVSFRGPWAKTWEEMTEIIPREWSVKTLTWGRKEAA